jgi:hypothetical protein
MACETNTRCIANVRSFLSMKKMSDNTCLKIITPFLREKILKRYNLPVVLMLKKMAFRYLANI